MHEACLLRHCDMDAACSSDHSHRITSVHYFFPVTKNTSTDIQKMKQPTSYNRRQFFKSAAISATGLGMAAMLPDSAWAGKIDDVDNLDVRINRVIRCEVNYERPRIVAGNSKYRLAGKYRSDRVLLAFGDNGKIGLGRAVP